MFKDKHVVCTIKYDGESTSLYNDGTFHARSLDSKKHESRDWLHQWWQSKVYSDEYIELSKTYNNLRLVGENMYATHTIKYNNLDSLFLLHSAWNGKTCLSWEHTAYIAAALNVSIVPCVYFGIYSEQLIQQFNTLELFNDDTVEGYIIRSSGTYDYMESDLNIAKFVSNRFKIDVNKPHWYYNSIQRNDVLSCI